jgi:RNA polymerase sigma-70 factor (ECF subfamily)
MSNSADRLSERVLVLRCQTGDGAAFEQLVVEFSPRLHYFLRRILGETNTIEDVLQDTWLQAFRGLPTLADAGAFRTWLYRIARDRAYREFRRRSPPVQLREDSEEVQEPDERNDFPAESIEQVHAALERLGREHREVLVLRFLEGMSYEDIARVTGCPLGTVRSRIHYAKRALHSALKRGES